jgi:hypothetical protein
MNTSNGVSPNEAPSAQALAVELLNVWATAFAENSPAAMALLYQDDCMFYGSKAELFLGSEGAMRYFCGLTPRRHRKVIFSDVSASYAGSNAVAVAATAQFVVADTQPFAARWTQTWVLEEGRWLVLSHHASQKQAFAV